MVPAYEGKKPYIFVSYAHKDSVLVLPVIENLYKKNYRIWYDEGIAPGSEWPKNIADHLNGASGVLYFISPYSLASPNCENEVKSGNVPEKEIYQFLLSKEKHPLLDGSPTVTEEAALVSVLNERYIGDGTGYERKISGRRYRGFWNFFLSLSGILLLVLGLILWGLKQGYFDSWLPGIHETAALQTTAVVTAAQKSGEEFSDSALEKAIASQVGKEDLYESLSFPDSTEKNSFYNAFGLDTGEELSLKKISELHCENVYFFYATDYTLELLPYVQDLKEVRISDGEITDLSPLENCLSLEKVSLAYRLFPVTVPEDIDFTVSVCY